MTPEIESFVHMLLALLMGHGISEGLKVNAARVCRWLTTTGVASTTTSTTTSTTIALPYLGGSNKGVN
jgi:hypothetical protein